MERSQTLGEEIANAVSHGTGAALAAAGTVIMIVHACLASTAISVVSASLYGASLIILYTFSTLYHSITNSTGKKVLRIFDHCSIFLLILGSYIPISLCLVRGAFGWTLFGINTACAVLGITLNSVNLKKWEKLSMALYVIMGWSVVASVKTVISAMEPEGIFLLVLGGILYTLGIIFYKNKTIKYMHFIWHIFVVGGSVAHFFCILKYVL